MNLHLPKRCHKPAETNSTTQCVDLVADSPSPTVSRHCRSSSLYQKRIELTAFILSPPCFSVIFAFAQLVSRPSKSAHSGGVTGVLPCFLFLREMANLKSLRTEILSFPTFEFYLGCSFLRPLWGQVWMSKAFMDFTQDYKFDDLVGEGYRDS
jgi:hypothetical protein